MNLADRIPLYLECLGVISEKNAVFFQRLAAFETKMLAFDIVDIQVTKPIFVTGLARSGTTVILEALNAHPDTASHQYGDYPFPLVNCFWNNLRMFFPSGHKKAERAHKDRLTVNGKSPEAIDEMIWMGFFDGVHNIGEVNELDKNISNKVFEDFFPDHIKKLLFLRKGKRYLSKNNYVISRIGYILKLFPDARFIVPLRDPLSHIYSMVKQHRLIASAQEADPRAVSYMRRNGHFEFGLDFRPLKLSQDSGQHAEILRVWGLGDVVKAYALYWNYIYRYIYDTLYQDEALKQNCYFVRYDDFCAHTEEHLAKMLDFCDLPPSESVMAWSDKISRPQYYTIDFTDEERKLIKKITGDTEKLFWTK